MYVRKFTQTTKPLKEVYLAINQYIVGIFEIKYFYWNCSFVYTNLKAVKIHSGSNKYKKYPKLYKQN